MTGWHYAVDGNTLGPIPEQQLRLLLAEGALDADTLLWTEGMAEWCKASETAALPDGLSTEFRPALAASKNPGWYYMYGGEPRGPIPQDELRSLVSQGAFDRDALVWTVGMPNWQKLLETGQFTQSDTATIAKDGSAAVNLRIGEVLRQSLNTLRARVGTWLLLGVAQLAVTLPLTMVGRAVGSPPLQYSLTGVVLAIILLAQTIVAFGAFQTHQGQPFHLGQALQRGFQRFLPALGIVLLLILALAIVLFLCAVVYGVVEGLLGFHGDARPSVFAATIFGGLFFAVRAFVAIPSCVIDGLGPVASLSRSFRLTKGLSWRIFALILLSIAPFALIMAALISTLVFVPELRPAFVGNTIIHVIGEFLLMPLRWLPIVFVGIVGATTFAKLQAPSGLPAEKIAEVFE